MELWARIGKTNKKFQGSFLGVMENLLKEAKGKKNVELLSFHAGQKERRRLKRELRRNGKDLVATARSIARWHYIRDIRRTNRKIKELKKRARYISKGEVLYCPKVLEKVEELKVHKSSLESKLEGLAG